MIGQTIVGNVQCARKHNEMDITVNLPLCNAAPMDAPAMILQLYQLRQLPQLWLLKCTAATEVLVGSHLYGYIHTISLCKKIWSATITVDELPKTVYKSYSVDMIIICVWTTVYELSVAKHVYTKAVIQININKLLFALCLPSILAAACRLFINSN